MRPLPRCVWTMPVVGLVALVLLAGGGAAWAASRADEVLVAASDPPADAPEQAQNAKPDEAKSADAAPAETPAKRWIRGSFEGGFDAIWADGESDFNLNQSLRLQVDPPQCPRLHLRGALWMQEDLNSNGGSASALRDIYDASEADVHVRPLYLYADIDNLWGKSTLRIGRQRILEGPAFNRIDGVYFKQQCGPWDWYVFGGTRATFYGQDFRDPVTGGGTSLRIGDKTRVALDAYYGENHRAGGTEVDRGPLVSLLRLQYPRSVKEDISDTAVAFSVWQMITPNLTLFGRFDYHEAGGNELRLNATGLIPAWDLTYELMYRRQLNTFGDRVNDFTGFYRILGPEQQHDDYFVALHKPLVKKLVLSLEAEFRNAHGHSWETANQDYQRYAAILSVDKLWNSVDAQIGLERWHVTDGEGTWAVTGEVTKHWSCVAVTVGADYARYEDRIVQYNAPVRWLDQLRVVLFPGTYQRFSPWVYLFDTWAVELHQNIHSVYAKTKWTIKKDQDLTAKITYEEDDGPESPYWRVQSEYAIRF